MMRHRPPSTWHLRGFVTCLSSFGVDVFPTFTQHRILRSNFRQNGERMPFSQDRNVPNPRGAAASCHQTLAPAVAVGSDTTDSVWRISIDGRRLFDFRRASWVVSVMAATPYSAHIRLHTTENRNSKMNRQRVAILLFLLALGSAGTLLAACGTVHGAGDDLERSSNAVRRAM